MSDKARIKIAAAVTALFLASISAAGLAAHSGQPRSAATPSVAPQARTSAADVLATGDDRDGRIEDDE